MKSDDPNMPHTVSTPVFAHAADMPFLRAGLARVGAWLSQEMGLTGLVTMPPSPTARPMGRDDTPLETNDMEDLLHFSDAISQDTFSVKLEDRHQAEGEPLFLRLLRRHDGLSALPCATLFPFSALYLQRMIARTKQYGFTIITSQNALDLGTQSNCSKNLGVHLSRLNNLEMLDVDQGLVQISPGTGWPALAGLAAPHGFLIPHALSNRFETPFVAAQAGLFNIQQSHMTGEHITALTLRLNKKAQQNPTSKKNHHGTNDLADMTFYFAAPESAAQALLDITELCAPYMIEVIPSADLNLSERLDYWSRSRSRILSKLLNRHHQTKPITGLRVILADMAEQQSELSTRQHLARKIIRHHKGKAWRIKTPMRFHEKAAALLYSGTCEVSQSVPFNKNQEVMPSLEALKLDTAAAQSIMVDSVHEITPFQNIQPVTGLALMKTLHRPLEATVQVWYPRDPSRAAEEWRDIYQTAKTRMASVFAAQQEKQTRKNFSDITTPLRPQVDDAVEQPVSAPDPAPDPDATSQSEEWQAIREALLSDFGPIGGFRKNGHDGS